LSRGRWWCAQNRTGRRDGDGRRGERSAASEPGRRENGDCRAGTGAWKRKKGGGWSARGEEGPGQGTDLGTADAGGALCGNRGGAGTGTWAAVGEAAGTAAMDSA
jgi:hypothetical protein